jgi:outer membrane protein assembly factor BamB
MRKLIWATALLCLCCAVAATAADWPSFLGPTRNGLAPDTGLNKDWAAQAPREVWRVPLSDKGYAGPSVADGKVFVVDHEGATDIVRALKLEDGQQVWQCAYPDLEEANFGFTEATPVYAEGLLYILSRLGTIQCLNAADGQLVWSRSATREFDGRAPGWLFAESLLVDGNKVVVCTGAADRNVIALDRLTGELIWRGGNGDMPGYATAVPAEILGQRQYVICTGSNVIGVNAADGKQLWAIPWKNEGEVNASLPIVTGNSVFITSGYGIGCGRYEITPNGPVEKWRNKDIAAHFSSPVYYNGYIYSNSDPGNLVCMAPETGAVSWRQGGFEKGGLIIVDGVILALTGNGGDLVMAQADPTAYHELGRMTPLGGQSWTAPILADGRLIVRNTEAMACLDLR